MDDAIYVVNAISYKQYINKNRNNYEYCVTVAHLQHIWSLCWALDVLVVEVEGRSISISIRWYSNSNRSI